MQEFELQMTQRVIPKEEEEEPGIVQIKSIDNRNEKMHIYIPPGTVYSKNSLSHFICDTFSNLAGDTNSFKKGTNNTKFGDTTHPPDASP